MKENTIAAISTPIGSAGIGKIRISGPDALKISDRLFRGVSKRKLSEVETYTAHYGYVIDFQSGKQVDEVVVIVMRKPHSFTGEDVVEFDCHGGIVPLRRVLDLILKSGARLAEPGEFSKRAFLNGKIDLAQAEGIIEVINSKTEKGLEVAINHLTGKLSDKVTIIKEKVIKLLAHLEATIDFPEDEIDGFDSSQLKERLLIIKEEIEGLLATSNQGKIYQEGIKTVIAGKPNVGKSSLLNAFLEETRAIVTDVPGTTRDVIEEFINIDGVPLKIIDTAGIRETEDIVEKLGVKKTRSSIKNADLILFILDIFQGLTKTDFQIYDLIKEKPVIIVVNKTDLKHNIKDKELDYFADHPLIKVSVKKEDGLEELKKAIINEVLNEEVNNEEEIFITKARHKNALERSLKALNRVMFSLNQRLPFDFLTIDLKDCLEGLGEITGETVTEDIIERIFHDFCLGK